MFVLYYFTEDSSPVLHGTMWAMIQTSLIIEEAVNNGTWETGVEGEGSL